jgi:hypothetical protein
LLALESGWSWPNIVLWLTVQAAPKEKEKKKPKDKKKKKKSKRSISSPLIESQSPDPGSRLKVTKFTNIRWYIVGNQPYS